MKTTVPLLPLTGATPDFDVSTARDDRGGGDVQMPDSQLTKKALAQAMKEAMAELPLEKIRINDIVKRCSMNRQSFYYHFKDKYDLVNWIFYTEFFGEIREHLDNPDWELLKRICEYFYKNRDFYRNALQVTGQNSFYDYFVEVLHSIFITQFNEIFEEDPPGIFTPPFWPTRCEPLFVGGCCRATKHHPKSL